MRRKIFFIVFASLFLFTLAIAQNTSQQVSNSNNAINSTDTTNTGFSDQIKNASPEVKSALIGLVASLLVAILTSVVSIYIAVSLNRKVNSVQTAIKSQSGEIAKRFLCQTGSLKIISVVKDFDGTTETKTQYNDVKTIREDVTVAYIPGETFSNYPESEFSRDPEITKPGFARALNITVYDRKATSYKFNVDITGSLHYDERLSYEISEEMKKGFMMINEDVKTYSSESFKKEFHSFNIVSLIGELEISVEFPKGFQTKFFYGAVIGSVLSEPLIDPQEIQRIEKSKGFEQGENWARLRVEEPYVGYTYLIYWVPPAKAVIDALKNTRV